MNSQINEKLTKKPNAPTTQQLKADLEKKLHSENAQVFQQLFGVKAPEKNNFENNYTSAS